MAHGGALGRVNTPRPMHGQQARADPDSHADHDIAWVVNASVHARIGNGSCQRHQGRRQRWQLSAGAGDKRGRCRAMARRKRRRSWCTNEGRVRPREGSTSAREQLCRTVGHHRCDRDGHEAASCRPPPLPPAEYRERTGEHEPQSRVVRRARNGDEDAIHRGRASPERASHQPAVQALNATPHRHLRRRRQCDVYSAQPVPSSTPAITSLG